MTDRQKEIIALAKKDIENGVNTEWAEFVITLILSANEESE